MDITHDGKLEIATGFSAKSKVWKNKSVDWSWLVEKLKNVTVTNETQQQYKSASKEERISIKDVGGYFGGKLKDGLRHPENVINRTLLYLDLDNSTEFFWDDFYSMYRCAAVLHSTHSHEKHKPKHRLIIPLSRSCSTEEYEAVARKVAYTLCDEQVDSTTFQKNRFMFWPSVSSDAEYEFHFQDGAWLNVDDILSTYADWKDTSSWPRFENDEDYVKTAAKKQEDPLTKSGIVGAFCRAYTIQDAIATFLSDVYVESVNGRYSYTKGTTAAGLLVYEDIFSYSYHSTDPSSGRLCNAFDLVRIHKFKHLDSGQTTKQANALKSYKAMEDFALADNKTKLQLASEKLAEAKIDFDDDYVDKDNVDLSWTTALEANSKGDFENSATNLNLIIKNDVHLSNVFKLNVFDNRRYISKSVPWRKVDGLQPLKDVDYAGVRNYIETVYGIAANQKVDDVIALEFERNAYHPIRNYLTALTWDGVKRVETLLIDYFGSVDDDYTRAVTVKTLVGAVSRVMNPGCKFDTILVLVGAQKTFKSTFIKKLGKEWSSESFSTVQGKEAFEQLQGFWIIEVAELAALKKAEIEQVKHFISKTEDAFRPAYGRVLEIYKRQCIFIGSTNIESFLLDPTGNRRFLPVKVNRSGGPGTTKKVTVDLDNEVDQIWAEAFHLYKNGETSYLTEEQESIAAEQQSNHFVVDERVGLISNYLDTPLPKDWKSFDLLQRRIWLEDPIASIGTELRAYVCIAEIWCECLKKEKGEMSRYNTREINDMMKSLPDWEYVNSTKIFPLYGIQKYYARKLD